MAKETEDFDLNPELVGRGVKKILEDPQTGFYLGAFLNDELVGSLLILFEWSDWRCRNVLWLHSLYVKPELRNQGIFKKMYAFLQNLVNANSESYAGIRLYVDKRNQLAKDVYDRIGMTNEHYDLFEWLV